MTGHPCVVAGVDFSEISPFVVATALRAARRLGRSLRVLHAMEDLGGDGDGPVLPTLKHRIEEARREARASLVALLDGLGLAVVPDLDSEVVTDARWKRLVSSDAGVALLVVGAPHPGPSLGSFGGPLLRSTSCPVLVARRPTVGGHRKIVVGVDFSPGSEHAWDLALQLAEPEATVVACLAGFPEGEPGATEALKQWVRGRPGEARSSVLVSAGSARDVLVQSARAGGFDLVAVGRSGHGALHDLLLGSTAQHVARAAPCDVVIAGSRGVPSS